MEKEGVLILLGGRWYMSAGHTDDDVNMTLEAVDKSMAKL